VGTNYYFLTRTDMVRVENLSITVGSTENPAEPSRCALSYRIPARTVPGSSRSAICKCQEVQFHADQVQEQINSGCGTPVHEMRSHGSRHHSTRPYHANRQPRFWSPSPCRSHGNLEVVESPALQPKPLEIDFLDFKDPGLAAKNWSKGPTQHDILRPAILGLFGTFWDFLGDSQHFPGTSDLGEVPHFQTTP
jgi:hypothetical protein